MPRFSIMFARFPFQNSEAPSTTNWLIDTVAKLKSDPRIGDIHHREYDDTPITLSRNKCMKEATELKVDFLLMIDSDMWPDIGFTNDYHIPGAKRFFPTAFEFAINHAGPCVVAAPYCGPPPFENVYIFQPGRKQTNNPNFDFSIDQFTREQAAQRGGFEQVMALPTGLMLLDMRCVHSLRHPYFAYEWTDETQSEKGSTEDVYFSRNLALAGVPQYVAWDCWAGHWKRKCVTKPLLLTVDNIRKEYQDAIMRGQRSDEKLVMVGEGRSPAAKAVLHDSFIGTVQPKSPVDQLVQLATFKREQALAELTEITESAAYTSQPALQTATDSSVKDDEESDDGLDDLEEIDF